MSDKDRIPDGQEKGRSIGSLVAIGLIAVLVVVWIALNSESTEVNWLLFKASAPLAVVILIAAVAGWAIGSLSVYLIRRRRQ